MDQEISGRLITARVHQSPDRGPADVCVDTEVPVSTDAQPIAVTRGDTLFILQQAIVGERRPRIWYEPLS
jgi:hypothetical protein